MSAIELKLYDLLKRKIGEKEDGILLEYIESKRK
jgi:hypothetical protein